MRICRKYILFILPLFVTLFLVATFTQSDIHGAKNTGGRVKKYIDRTVDRLSSQSKVCQNVTITKEECEVLTTTEQRETLLFPLQYISGATGSGNDWIMWLATISMYTWPRERRHAECEVYDRQKRPEKYKMKYVNETHCLFFKSHEPWWLNKNFSNRSARGALLLRHPYDAAFSEYKRQLVKREAGAEDWKASNAGLTVDKFIDLTSNQTNKELVAAIHIGTQKWLNHAKYWLTKYTNPVHVLIYNNVKANTAKEIEDVQKFFGYKFNGVNFRRHCCVMANLDTVDLTLKRKPSGVDQYKEIIYSKEKKLQEIIELAVSNVHAMLDRKFPGSHYRVTRG